MGRGRAKAKQTKVARELKYRNGGTDLSALQAELAGGSLPTRSAPAPARYDDLDDDVPPELLYDGRYDVPDEDEDDWVPARRQS
jgi:hypothetical protein